MKVKLFEEFSDRGYWEGKLGEDSRIPKYNKVVFLNSRDCKLIEDFCKEFDLNSYTQESQYRSMILIRIIDNKRRLSDYNLLHRGGRKVADRNCIITIIKHEDDWFWVEFERESFYYCDQIDGVLNLLRDYFQFNILSFNV